MPARPDAVENLRVTLSSLVDATGLFDAVARSTDEFFRSPERRKRILPAGQDPRTVEPGQERLSDANVLVRRRTLDVEDSGEFVVDTESWLRRREGLEGLYREWQAEIDVALECAVGLRNLRGRFCTNLSVEWFSDLLADLHELKDMRHPAKYKDGSSFWKYGNGQLPPRASELIEKIKRAWMMLADPVLGAASGKYTEEDVLRLIGTGSLRFHELPADMGARHFRPLDLKGLIVVRQWIRHPRESGHPRFPVFEEQPWQWFSPCASPPSAGDLSWDTLFRTIAPPLNPSPEVKLSDAGLVALEGLDGGGNASEPELSVSDDFGYVKFKGTEYVFSDQARLAIAELFGVARKNDGGMDVDRLGTKILSNARRFRLDACFRLKDGSAHPGFAALVEVLEGGRVRVRPDVARKWRAE